MNQVRPPRIVRLHLPENQRILAISDIHGNLEYLQRLLEKVAFGEDDVLFLVGDMLEKGPRSLDLLHYVMDLQHRLNVYPICGNCEGLWQFMLTPDHRGHLKDYLLHRKNSLLNEMIETFAPPVTADSDMESLVREVELRFHKELEWLRTLPNIIETDHLLFVHAGVQPDVPLAEQDRFRVMDTKAFYEQPVSFTDRICIVGHWPVVLYQHTGQNASPILDHNRKIYSIDGGNVLKRDGQLNCLVLNGESGEDASWIAYDDYPQIRLLDDQQGSTDNYNITWSENTVEVLEQRDDVSLIRQCSSGYEMWVPTEYLYPEMLTVGTVLWHVEDSTDAKLSVQAGEQASLVCETSMGAIIKKDGISGWYAGRYERLPGENRHLPGFWREKL